MARQRAACALMRTGASAIRLRATSVSSARLGFLTARALSFNVVRRVAVHWQQSAPEARSRHVYANVLLVTSCAASYASATSQPQRYMACAMPHKHA